jgi:hypothetical protein
MGEVAVEDKKIPIVLRHSDRIRAERTAKDLKKRILEGEFILSEPVGDIEF